MTDSNKLFDIPENNQEITVLPLDLKKSAPKKAKKALSEERKAQLREQLARGRATSARKRGETSLIKKIEKEETEKKGREIIAKHILKKDSTRVELDKLRQEMDELKLMLKNNNLNKEEKKEVQNEIKAVQKEIKQETKEIIKPRAKYVYIEPPESEDETEPIKQYITPVKPPTPVGYVLKKNDNSLSWLD